MAKAKKKVPRTQHELYEQARKEVEGNQKAGPITRLVKIPSVEKLDGSEKVYWQLRLNIERELLVARHDKQASRKPPAELARQKCARLLLENHCDRLKVEHNGHLWEAIAAIDMRAMRIEAMAQEASDGVCGVRLGMSRMAMGLANTLQDSCPNCGGPAEEKDGE